MAAALFVGLRGTIVAIDRTTGDTLWSTRLKGADFVTVAVDEGQLFAATKGRIYRLDPVTGDVQWYNDLPGLGYGIVSIGGTQTEVMRAERKRRDAQTAAAGA